MHLENEIPDGFKINKNFYEKIDVRTSIQIDERIKKLFLYATSVLAFQLEKESIPINRTCSCIFTDSDRFTLSIEEISMGEYRTICVYPIHKWTLLNDVKILACILEELCHYYFNINDEVSICYKVLEVIKNLDIYKSLELKDIYSLSEIERLKALQEE